MLRKFPYLFLITLLAGSLATTDARGQIPYQVVPLTAQVTDSPPSITLQWPLDPTAPFYKVRRKAVNDVVWEEVAVLSGSAQQYVDADVQTGDVWEYSVTRSEPLPTMDTLCVTAGTGVTFTVNDSYGNGLCCWNSNGFWQLYACGELIAEGGEYEFQDQHQFVMCGSQKCEELVVVLYPDHQFEEISWDVYADDGTLLGQGAPEMAPMFGYITAGIDVPAIEQRGTLMLLVDQAITTDLAQELDRLEQDLIGEGWLVLREEIPAGTAVTQIKSTVQNTAATTSDLSALLLIGKIPVPYSGVIAPDEHEDHVGAWPADLYYAELDGPWTDGEVDWQPWGVPARNHNAPGDGRFDQSTLPSDVDLMIGRIDLSDLPVYPYSEIELLRFYLDRDHLFRSGALNFERKAVVNENFSNFDHEAAVYRSCIPMFGEANVYDSPFLETLSMQSPLWSMAGGPGSFASALGIGTSQDVAATQLNGAFAHVIGSYFGDWDTQNNFLRTILANGSMLGVVWGLQEISFHRMALGGLIGESVLFSQNASYETYERQGRLVNLSLMGDPTLQLFPAPRVDSVQAEVFGEGVMLEWPSVQGTVEGYHIYRRNDPNMHFERINASPIAGLSFLDTDPVPGDCQYMVRALKRETTSSGTYFVLGTGAITGIALNVSIDENTMGTGIVIAPNPGSGSFHVRSTGDEKISGIEMFDLGGKSIAIDRKRNGNGWAIESNATAGIYVLEVIHEDGSRSKHTLGITE